MKELILPWPSLKPLSPNWRGHWGAKAAAKKQFRLAWSLAAVQQGAARIDADRLHVQIEFVPPDRRARDLDNMLASCKSGVDGLADVLGVDDSKWSLSISKAERIGGFVRVIITEVGNHVR